MVNLLNEHPRVFITHESDVVWILYQLFTGRTGNIETYPLDDSKGLPKTLEVCGHLLPPGPLNKEETARLFYRLLHHVNRYGREGWDKGKRKQHLAWVRDKKSVQHSEPRLQEFLNDVFPTARYIHIIRNPRYAVASMVEAATKWRKGSVPTPWRGSPQEVLAHWVTTQEWVLDVKRRMPDRVLTVWLEDLAGNAVGVSENLFGFLGLDLSPDVHEVLREWVWKEPNKRHAGFDLPISDRAEEIMQHYGYQTA